MAYDKNEIFERAKEAIKSDEGIVFIEDLVVAIGISKATFYDYYPPNSDEINFLKDLMLDNKSTIKKRLREKWYQSDNATLNVCAYKLLSNDEERKLLADKQEVTHSADNDIRELYLEHMKNLKPSGRE